MASAIERGLKEVRDLIDQRTVTISLVSARDKDLIEKFRECDYIEIDSITSGASAQLRFNSPSNPTYQANKYRRFKTTKEQPFKKLYVTNTAQAACTLVLKCGGDATMIAERESAISEIVNPLAVKDSAGTTIDPSTSTDVAAVATAVGALQAAAETLADVITAVNAVATAVAATNTELAKKTDEATAATIYNVVMTTANTEYSQALPANCKRFSAQMRENDTAFRIAYETGKVAAPTAPYYTVQAAKEYYEDMLDLSGKTLYFGCGSAGKNIEIIAWT